MLLGEAQSQLQREWPGEDWLPELSSCPKDTPLLY